MKNFIFVRKASVHMLCNLTSCTGLWPSSNSLEQYAQTCGYSKAIWKNLHDSIRTMYKLATYCIDWKTFPFNIIIFPWPQWHHLFFSAVKTVDFFLQYYFHKKKETHNFFNFGFLLHFFSFFLQKWCIVTIPSGRYQDAKQVRRSPIKSLTGCFWNLWFSQWKCHNSGSKLQMWKFLPFSS